MWEVFYLRFRQRKSISFIYCWLTVKARENVVYWPKGKVQMSVQMLKNFSIQIRFNILDYWT